LAVNAKLKVGQVLKLPRNDSSGELLTTSYTPVQIDDAGVQQNQEKQAQNKENDELDARLSKILDEDASKQSDQNGKKVIPLGQNSGFNEQESALASPKITHTAKGETVSSARTTEVSGKMQMPTKGKVVSRFGEMIDGIPNDGINIKASAGTPVNAVSDGEVVYAGNKLDESFGNVVIVKHNDGLISSYANMQDIAKGMRQGAKVKAGQRVGTVGMTGDVSTPQLHFEIMKDNTPLNPEKYLNM